MASYGHQSLVVEREEDLKPFHELLSGGNSPKLSRVPEEQGPFLYLSSPKEEEQPSRAAVEPFSELPMSDIDLVGFLDMDDKTLSGKYNFCAILLV